MPGVIDQVVQWESRLLSPGLVDAVARSWEDRNYVNVVRDAFVYLEQALRGVGKVPSTDGVTAVQLVNRLFTPESAERIELPGKPRTGGEVDGVRQLLAGTFKVFRNPAAHRPVDFEPGTASEILSLVDLCLRMLGTEETPGLEIHLGDGADVVRALEALEEMAGRHPGTAIVRVVIDEEMPDEMQYALSARVTVTTSLCEEIQSLEDVEAVIA